MTGRRLLGLCVLFSAMFVLGPGGTSVAQESDPDFWGTGTNIHYVSAEEFNCSYPANCNYHDCGDNYWCDSTGYRNVYAPVRLPVGALIQGYRVVYDDSSASLDLAVRLYRAYQWNTVGGSLEIKSFVSSGSPGLTTSYVDVDPDHTVFYRYFVVASFGYNSYYLWVTTPPTLSVQFRGVLVYWSRQISPAPASQTFPDVAPGYWAFQEIEALAASGITSGFPDGTFRPTEPVTRAQMATFLARALGLHWAP